MDVRIEQLYDHPEFVETVAAWLGHEWGGGTPDASLEQWRDRLRGRSNRSRVPFTLTGLVRGEPVASVSVRQDDDDMRFAAHGPWLSGMFVIGAPRNHGIGRALLRAAEDHARRFGAMGLWLHTGEAPRFYERCGWNVVVPKQQLREDAVMRSDL